jgi:hypothetical protein
MKRLADTTVTFAGSLGGLAELRFDGDRPGVALFLSDESTRLGVALNVDEREELQQFLTLLGGAIKQRASLHGFQLSQSGVALCARYDNAGEPFREGVCLSLEMSMEGRARSECSVFLEEEVMLEMAAVLVRGH